MPAALPSPLVVREHVAVQAGAVKGVHSEPIPTPHVRDPIGLNIRRLDYVPESGLDEFIEAPASYEQASRLAEGV